MFLIKSKHFIFLFFFLTVVSCSKNYNKSPHILAVDEYYLNKQFAKSLDVIRPRTLKAKDKDKLLYLMEAGSILHTMQEWEKSNLVFEEANEIAETISKSFSKELLSFLINENQNNFRGESFERVKIKLYIALNYLMLNDYENADRFFRRLSWELKDIRDLESDYKQNHAARYLSAILSENLKNYNNARIEYNNMLLSQKYIDIAKEGLYVLATLENDQEDLELYKKWSTNIPAYDSNFNQIALNKDMGSLVVIHESGLAPIKISRGKIGDDETYRVFLDGAISTAIASKGYVGVDETALLSTVARGENPIPIYVKRKEKNTITIPNISISNLVFKPIIMDNYTTTAIQSYNEAYPAYVKKNISSIVVKVLAVFITKQVVKSSQSDSNLGALLGILISGIGGGIIASSLEPDLRSWNLTYDNLQIKRIWLNPGNYSLKIDTPQPLNYLSHKFSEVKIESKKTKFIIIKSF